MERDFMGLNLKDSVVVVKEEQSGAVAVHRGYRSLMVAMVSGPPPPSPVAMVSEQLLYIAAENNNQEVFDYLIKFCDLQTVKIRSKADFDPFLVAAERGYLGIVSKLLSLWPELCKVCDVKNTSPLYYAAVKDHLDVVNAILDADVTCIRIVRKNGKTALHTAARYVLTLIEYVKYHKCNTRH